MVATLAHYSLQSSVQKLQFITVISLLVFITPPLTTEPRITLQGAVSSLVWLFFRINFLLVFVCSCLFSNCNCCMLWWQSFHRQHESLVSDKCVLCYLKHDNNYVCALCRNGFGHSGNSSHSLFTPTTVLNLKIMPLSMTTWLHTGLSRCAML